MEASRRAKNALRIRSCEPRRNRQGSHPGRLRPARETDARAPLPQTGPRDREVPRPDPLLERTLHAPPDPALGRVGGHADRVVERTGHADSRPPRRSRRHGGALGHARGGALRDAARPAGALRPPGSPGRRPLRHRPDRPPPPRAARARRRCRCTSTGRPCARWASGTGRGCSRSCPRPSTSAKRCSPAPDTRPSRAARPRRNAEPSAAGPAPRQNARPLPSPGIHDSLHDALTGLRRRLRRGAHEPAAQERASPAPGPRPRPGRSGSRRYARTASKASVE